MTKLTTTCAVSASIPIMVVAAFALLLLTGCGEFFPDNNDLVSIMVTPTNSTLQLSNTQQFKAIGTFGDSSSSDISSSVTWTSSSNHVATINSSGVATAVATGTTTITASESDLRGSTNLTVSINGGGLTVSPSSQSISGSQTVQFTLNGSSVSGVSWSSSRTTIATIDQDGVATGLAVGTTTITATATISGTQYQGTANLTVQ